MPLASGMKETVCAPTLLVLTARYARNVPSASSASSAWTTRSRAWQSLISDSRRSPVHVTGRPMRLAGDGTSRDRVRGHDDRRQRLPIDDDTLGAVARGERRLGDDHGDGLADEADAIDGQRKGIRDEERRAVGTLERHFVWIRRHRPM